MILTFVIHINKKTNRKRQGTNDTYFLNSKDQNTLSKKKKKTKTKILIKCSICFNGKPYVKIFFCIFLCLEVLKNGSKEN